MSIFFPPSGSSVPEFVTHASLEFPITEILDFLLGKAADYVISQQGDRIPNTMRIPIASLRILEDVAYL